MSEPLPSRRLRPTLPAKPGGGLVPSISNNEVKTKTGFIYYLIYCLFFLSFITALPGYFLIIGFQPIHSFTTGGLIILACTPILFIVYIFLRAKSPLNIPTGNGSQTQPPEIIAGIIVLNIAIYILAFAFIVNEKFDHSKPTTHDYIVVRTAIYSKGGPVALIVDPYSKSSDAFATIFPTLIEIRISASDYDKIIPNVSSINVTFHGGFFGWPWLDP